MTGHVAIVVTSQAKGHSHCQATLTLDDRSYPPEHSHGQNQSHAIANALEALARELRRKTEADQKVDWDTVDRSADGRVVAKRFHVVLHYEHVGDDESKFEAFHNTLMGNTVVENAEVSIIQIDPDLAIEPWHGRS